jgi:hypothetical protein
MSLDVPTSTGAPTRGARADIVRGAPEQARRARWRSDGLVVALLCVAAVATRRDGLPRDGLWHDDAVAAAGAVKGSLSQLLVTGVDHPTYTLGLRMWDGMLGYDALGFVVPGFVAGVLGPAALFLVLRDLGYERSICAMLGAALVVGDVHIVYSGRVRPYTIDLLVVLALVVAVPRLVRITRSPRVAVACGAAGALLGSVSAFALVAVIVAGIVLVLHPAFDIRLRIAVLVVLALGGFVFLRAVQGQYDEAEQAHEWEEIWDAFIDADPNPRVLAGDVMEHLERISAVFPGGPVAVDDGDIDLDIGWWSTAVVLVALGGLAWSALTTRQAVPARFLLLLLAVGFAAGALDRLPFGPAGTGARASLWLIPVFAVGLAAALHWVRGLVTAAPAFTHTFDVVLYVVAGAVLAMSFTAAPRYPHPGSETATEFVDEQLGARDAVFVLPGSMYAFALESDLDSTMRETPEDGIGFIPEFDDPRVTVLDDHFGVDERSRPLPDLATTDRVFVFSAWPGPVSPAELPRHLLDAVLPQRGFEPVGVRKFDDSTVWIWERAT